MAYVILHPHSNTNATSNYLVVNKTAWTRFIDKETRAYPIAKTCETYGEAVEARAALYREEADY